LSRKIIGSVPLKKQYLSIIQIVTVLYYFFFIFKGAIDEK
jgi:hypothetical protein